MTDHNFFTIIPYKDQLLKLDNVVRAKAHYHFHTIDLLSTKKENHDFNEWIDQKKKALLSSVEETPVIIHLFYELGFLIEKEFQKLNPDTLLAIEIEYADYKLISPLDYRQIELKLEDYPDPVKYRTAFNVGYEELVKGNCYQFNLTFPFVYSFSRKLQPLDFIFSLWKKKESRGAFGSATFIPYFNKLFLSNSPECLFQFKNKTLSSMPIKGTMPRSSSESWLPVWKKLTSDKKSQAELYMISDLLRNDLSRIDKPTAVIVKKKFPKLVPGLIHQYSQIDVELSGSVTLWRVIEKVFPGGSITGAPKLRAMRLIDSLEQRERGFYTGSTLIMHKAMKSASINIRACVIDFETLKLTYQAGGGITLLSEVDDEYQEMTYKHNSFISALTP